MDGLKGPGRYVRLPLDLDREVDGIAAEQGLKVSTVLRMAVGHGIGRVRREIIKTTGRK